MAPIIATTDVERPAAEVLTSATDPTLFHEISAILSAAGR